MVEVILWKSLTIFGSFTFSFKDYFNGEKKAQKFSFPLPGTVSHDSQYDSLTDLKCDSLSVSNKA